MDPDSKRLRIAVTDGRGGAVRAAGLTRWLARVAPPRARGELAIALVTDAHMRALNREYRRKDQPTDVLSFPALPNSTTRIPDPGSRTPGEQYVGDIVIAKGVARRQAREAGHSYDTEVRVLALHGLLHLLGYDHESAADRGRMAKLEARLRREGGLREGLIERAGDRLRPAREGGGGRRPASRAGARPRRSSPASRK